MELDPAQFADRLVSGVPDAIVYADAEGVIRRWNRGATRIFGFAEAEALGRSLDIIIPENLRERHWQGYRAMMRTGQTRYGDGQILSVPAMRKDGTRISVEFTIVPFTNDAGKWSASPRSCATPPHGSRNCAPCAVSSPPTRPRTARRAAIPGRDFELRSTAPDLVGSHMPRIETALTRLLAIEHPILLAPMGSAAGGKLAAAVTTAGGLGMIGSGQASGATIRQELGEAGNIRVGIGFITWALERNPAALDVALDARPAAVMLSFGDPTPFTGRIKAAGCKIICQVQTLAQAKEAASAGADIIIAQGRDAGGHSGTARGTMGLVPAVVDAVAPIPVVAVGGIADGRGLAAALALGRPASRWAPVLPPRASRCGKRR